MSKTEKYQPKLKHRVLNVIRLMFACTVRFWCRLCYGRKGKKIPPITNNVLKLPAMEVASKIRNKEITSVEVLEMCIKRIKEVNSALNFFIDNRFEVGFKEAKEADALIRGGTKTVEELEKEHPLLGVPFTTKDSISVRGLVFSCGVALRKNVIANKDAEVIELLKKSGAIVIGLTNVPELCMWWETNNKIYGRTKNPYNTTRIVGGSSGGEGSCQAAAGSIFGIGSDIGGSIRMPCFFNGIFGHKPSRHTVSNDGQYPDNEYTEFQEAFLSIGPMTRHASDLKPILNIIAGDKAPKLRLDEPVDFKKIKFYYQFSMDVPLTDKVDSEIITAMQKVLEFLKTQHNIQAEEKRLPLHGSLGIWTVLMDGDKPLGEYIMKKYTKCNVYKEIMKNAIGLSDNTLPALIAALSSEKKKDETTKMFAKKRDELEKLFTDLLGDDGVILFPTFPSPAPYHKEPIARPFNFIYSAAFNALGLPATAIPLGLAKNGLPIGIQVIAKHDNDRLCLAVAEQLDRALGGWLEPQRSLKNA